MPEQLLSADRATVSYGQGRARVSALNEVSIEFHPGELALITGPSGSGKTTLLSVLGCLLQPDAGRVFVNGVEATCLNEDRRTELRRRHVGFIFQAFRLFHSLSALENVTLSAEIAGRDGKERARELLSLVGMESKKNLLPKALSGGEQQRVAIARALLANPPVLLADEPTASLDSAAGRGICEILRDLAIKQGRLVVVVSHDPRWAAFAHRTATLEDGRLVDERRIG